MNDTAIPAGKFTYRHPPHHFAWFKRDTSGLWVFTTVGWWTWQSTRTPKPIADRVLRLIGDLLGGKILRRAA